MIQIRGSPLDILAVSDNLIVKDTVLICENGQIKTSMFLLGAILPLFCSLHSTQTYSHNHSIILTGVHTEEITTLLELISKGQCYVTATSLGRLEALKVVLRISIVTEKVIINIIYIKFLTILFRYITVTMGVVVHFQIEDTSQSIFGNVKPRWLHW